VYVGTRRTGGIDFLDTAYLVGIEWDRVTQLKPEGWAV